MQSTKLSMSGIVRGAMQVKLALFLVLCPAAFGQLFSIGLKSGVPLNDAYQKISNPFPDFSQTANTHRFIIGAQVEVHLPLRLAMEADALYRSSDYHYSYQLLNSPLSVSNTVRNLEFPVLLKWYVTPGVLRPFVEGGVTYRHIYLDNGNVTTSPDSKGGTVGAGVLFKLGPLKIAPEVRYTRWGSTAITAPGIVSSRDQSDFFLGFRF